MEFLKRITRSQTRKEGSSSGAQRLVPGSDDDRDPEAARYESQAGFYMPTRRQFNHYKGIYKRPIENTRLVDLDVLDTLGVKDEFLELTERVGFTKQFWEIDCKAYKRYTLEFLSSLELFEKDGEEWIQFRLGNDDIRTRVDAISQVLGLETGCPVRTLESQDSKGRRERLWSRITRSPGSDTVITLIEHPTLRILTRAISSMVFSRGETMRRATVKDLLLLDQILQPNPQKLCIAKLMVDHWIEQRNQSGTGAISMGAFVTLIASAANYDLPHRTDCTAWSMTDEERYKEMNFLTIEGTGPVFRYMWKLHNRPGFLLPYPHKVNPSDPSTWLVPLDYAEPAQHRGSMYFQPTPMDTDIPGSSGTHSGPIDYPPWYGELTGMMKSIMLEIRDTKEGVRKSLERQDDTDYHLGRLSNEVLNYGKRLEKLDDVAQVTYDNNFFLRYGYWPGDDNDPNLHSPEDFSSIPSVHSSHHGSMPHQQPQPLNTWHGPSFEPLYDYPPRQVQSNPFDGNRFHAPNEQQQGEGGFFDIFPNYNPNNPQGGPYGGPHPSN